LLYKIKNEPRIARAFAINNKAVKITGRTASAKSGKYCFSKVTVTIFYCGGRSSGW